VTFGLNHSSSSLDRGRPARFEREERLNRRIISTRSGRDARGPSEELEWSIHKKDLKTEMNQTCRESLLPAINSPYNRDPGSSPLKSVLERPVIRNRTTSVIFSDLHLA